MPLESSERGLSASRSPADASRIAPRKGQQTIIRSNLAEVRVSKGVTQHALARACGISLMTLRRLERQQLYDAPLWYYRNLAIALGVELDDILDERERDWRRRPSAPYRPPLGWLEKDAGAQASAGSRRPRRLGALAQKPASG